MNRLAGCPKMYRVNVEPQGEKTADFRENILKSEKKQRMKRTVYFIQKET